MIDQYPSPNGVLTSLIWRKTAAGGETSLSGYDNASQALSYTPGQEQVYLNGILLVRGDDYTATNGTSITGLSALAASDFVQVNCYNNFSVASLPTSGLTGTISNAQLQNSSITINGSAVSLGGSTTIAGGSAQDDAPTSPTEGQLWLDTNGTLATTAFVEKSTINAKGDLYVGTADNTVGILSSGNSGETIVADSSATTGLRWQPKAATNYALNSDFSIWQRGTSVTPTSNGGAYTADRWFGTRGSNTSLTVSRETAGNLSVSPNQAFRYCARVLRTASSTTTSEVAFGQMFETQASVNLAGQTVTLSGYIRKGALFSATSDVLTMSIIEGTGTDQKQMDGGYTGQNTVVSGNKTLTTAWQRFSVTGTIATSSTEITIKFAYTPTGTAGATDYFEVTGVQLELGSVPTAWNLAGGTLAGELAACQRYYVRFAGGQAYERFGYGYITSTTNANILATLPVTMRVVPTALDSGGNWQTIDTSATAYPITSFAIITNNSGQNYVLFDANTAGSLTAGRAAMVRHNNDTTAYIGWSAEL